jgi:5-carboxymethyl-2-hydroxymuconate isomerase
MADHRYAYYIDTRIYVVDGRKTSTNKQITTTVFRPITNNIVKYMPAKIKLIAVL